MAKYNQIHMIGMFCFFVAALFYTPMIAALIDDTEPFLTVIAWPTVRNQKKYDYGVCDMFAKRGFTDQSLVWYVNDHFFLVWFSRSRALFVSFFFAIGNVLAPVVFCLI